MTSKYYPIIGLEVHVELKTKSKMFCRCSADYFAKAPNTHTCPVCLGLPGALPVPNKTAIEWCIKIALALRCKINKFSKFDRKNYFYPDLPKGYQISQYDLPFGYEGYMELSSGKRIRIRRVHMEEDTGKLLHEEVDGEHVTLIDFNRSGVPLVEIVTEPDFNTPQEVKEYLQKLKQIVRYLDVSNADMEKGEMRLEPNISLKSNRHSEPVSGVAKNLERSFANAQDDNTLPPYKVEVKNINSFRFVERAITYEIQRQTEILDRGETPVQETRGWNETKGITVSQRMKEEAQDYRYFPEPDIPPIIHTDEQISTLLSRVPELPDTKLKRFVDEYDITQYDAEILVREKPLADYFEETIKVGKEHSVSPKQIANVIINKKIDYAVILPASLIKEIVSSAQVVQIDEKKLEAVIDKVLKDNEKAVAEYKKGKTTIIMFLIGQVMRNYREIIDAQKVKSLIEKKLQ